MSRCFPFPPPGYERKLRIDGGSVLAKEKEKEKKEKKHKKDKDKKKKEGKERDKEKSEERHREKDKKKEKHKHKDRDKKKEKKRTGDEKRFQGEGSNVEKVGSNSPQSNQFTGRSSVEQLSSRAIGYVDGARRNPMVDKLNDRDQGRGQVLDMVGVGGKDYRFEGKGGVDQKVNGQWDNSQSRFPKVAIVCNLNGVEQRRIETFRSPMEKDFDKSTQGNQRQIHHRSDKREEKGNGMQDSSKGAAFVQELGRRIRDDTNATGSQVNAKVGPTNRKRAESIGKMADGNASYPSQAKETSSFGNGVHKKANGQRETSESKGSRDAIVHNFKGLEQRGREMVRPADTSKVLREGAERNGYGTGAMVNKEKKIEPKEEDRDKAREQKKGKQGSECIIKLSRLGDSGGQSADDSRPDALRTSNDKAPVGITGKRKEPESNGFLHDNEKRPNKLPRTVLSSQLPTENGRKMQPCTTITLSASKHGTPKSLMVDSKEYMANGLMGARESPRNSTKPSHATDKANGTTGAQDYLLGSTKPPSTTGKPNGTMAAHGSPVVSTKLSSTSAKSKHKDKPSSKPPLPHPDTKYLSHILSIPKMVDWSEFDDQEWLFNSNSNPSKNTKLGSAEHQGDQLVWAKAVHIEPADVYALPYVIPY